jgi:hypothetical protein
MNWIIDNVACDFFVSIPEDIDKKLNDFNNLYIISLNSAGLKSLKHKISITNYRRTYSTISWRRLQKGSSPINWPWDIRLAIAKTMHRILFLTNFLRRLVAKLKKYAS